MLCSCSSEAASADCWSAKVSIMATLLAMLVVSQQPQRLLLLRVRLPRHGCLSCKYRSHNSFTRSEKVVLVYSLARPVGRVLKVILAWRASRVKNLKRPLTSETTVHLEHEHALLRQ